MKLNIIFMFTMIAGVLFGVDVKEYTPTGHDQFVELRFVDDRKKLLKDFSRKFIDDCLSDIKPVFWGSRTVYMQRHADATYVSDVVFSRSNKTREPFVFDYSLQTVAYDKRSISIEGSINIKGSIKKKQVEGNGTVDVKAKYATEDSFQETEKSAMKITVYPNKKMTLRAAGEAKISSGFTKEFVFWVCMKKGAWETVDIITSYFELVEEDA